HTPDPGSYICWSSAAWNACYRGNLALGLCGPEAVDAYMRENDPLSLSAWNNDVGHRRWVLYPNATDFASGDVPGLSNTDYRATNVLYVVPNPDELVATPAEFVSWPSRDYFPAPLMPTQWSVSYPEADFSQATVTMSDESGTAIAVEIVDRSTLDYGDPTIVWSVPESVSVVSVEQDTTYYIEVEGVRVGEETLSHHYRVIAFDPTTLTSDLQLTGTQTPPLEGANYEFAPIPEAEQVAILVAESEPVDWSVGAEDGASDYIVDETDDLYALRTDVGGSQSGKKAFRLVTPAEFENPDAFLGSESFIIDREVLPQANASVSYYRKRGFLTSGELFELQISTDGVSWTTIDSFVGLDTTTDGSFTQRTVELPEGSAISLRAVLTWLEGDAYDPSYESVGVFLDDFTFKNCEWVVSTEAIQSTAGSDSIRVDSQALGFDLTEGLSRQLRLQVELGGVPYRSSTALPVVFSGSVDNFSDWAAADYPSMTGGFDDDPDLDGLTSGVEYSFGLDPSTPSILPQEITVSTSEVMLTSPLDSLRSGVTYEIESSSDLLEWTSAGEVELQDGSSVEEAALVGTVSSEPEESLFLRWKVSEEP
ncbi:MAG: hypothetical protein ACQKBU_07630, partial [Verrucomicrobiales bacterium]